MTILSKLLTLFHNMYPCDYHVDIHFFSSNNINLIFENCAALDIYYFFMYHTIFCCYNPKIPKIQRQ